MTAPAAPAIAGPELLTPSLLSQALGGRVDEVSFEKVGSGQMGACYRVTVAGDGVPGRLTDPGYLHQAPIGIFRSVDHPTYDDQARTQITTARTGHTDPSHELDSLLHSATPGPSPDRPPPGVRAARRGW